MSVEQIEKKSFHLTCLSGFVLKIIAIVTMTFDHIGYLISAFISQYPGDAASYVSDAFRLVGRIALPIFCLLIVEGVIHTHSIKKYVLRLASIAFIILIAQIVMEFGMHYSLYQGNIFIDLTLGALMIYALKQKNRWIKLLAILPLLYGIISFVLFGYEYSTDNAVMVWWLPYFLRPQYFFLSFLFMLGFYFSYVIIDSYYRSRQQEIGISLEYIQTTRQYRLAVNVTMIAFLAVITIGLYLLCSYVIPLEYVFFDNVYQSYSLIAGAFILLYSGKRGYNAKWFEYGCYLYYPLHLVVLYAIFYLITM